MTTLFINYRRKDIPGLVEKLHQCLKEYYGDEVFVDYSKIEIGDSIPETIKKHIASCKLFLPVVGPNWDSDKYLQSLHQPNDWVRQEMEMAKSLKKAIFPIFINGGKTPDTELLPDSLKTGVFDIKGIELGEAHAYWPEEIKHCFGKIKKITGLEPQLNQRTNLDEEYLKLTACLNRDEEKRKLVESKNYRQSLFTASGSENSLFDRFAERCALNTRSVFRGILPGAVVKQLSWREYDTVSTADQSNILCRQIAELLSLPFEESRLVDLPERLNHFFSKLDKNQAYIFFTIRRGGSPYRHQSGAIGRWWDTWDKILGQQCSDKVAVLVFSVPYWWQTLAFSKFFGQGKPLFIGDFKNYMQQEMLYDWKNDFESYLDAVNKKSQFDLSKLDKEISSLFTKRKNVPYQDAVAHLEQTLAKTYLTTE
jgi:TIR domain